MVQNRAQFDDRIRNLLALAEDNSVESRTLLFSHICDLFLQERPMESDNQIRMLVEIINELISDVDISIRKELRDILLSIDDPPEVLMKLISEDVVEVSGKLLEEAMMDEEQLLYLIKYGTDDQREHIGRRFGLSPILRRELEKATKEKREVEELVAKAETTKISLQALEEAEQNSTELSEDATANILELLRGKKNATSEPEETTEEIEEQSSAPEVDDTAAPPKKEPLSLISKITEMAQSSAKDEEEADEEIVQATDDEIIADIPVEDQSDEAAEKEPTPTKDILKESGKRQKLHSANDQEPALSDEDDELILEHEAPQGGPTTVEDEWFWEIDRYGNIKYLSENAEAVFLQPPDVLGGEDFLCLWRRKGASDSDPNDFIALFEKRQPFRGEEFLFEISPNVYQSYSLSAIATFDIDSGRFTGFRGSAILNSNGIENVVPEENTAEEVHEDEIPQELVLTTPPEKEDQENHRPEFSGSLLEQEEDVASNADAQNIMSDANERDEVASELLHNLSHEFRTPLNAIIGFSQMIDNEMWGPVSDKYRKNTKNIINAANHLKEAVNNILDSAKMEAGLIEPSPESFSLKSVIQESMKALAPILESKEINVTGIEDNIDVILYNDKHCIILCLIKIITFATKRAEVGDNLQLSILVNSNAQVRIEIPVIRRSITTDQADDLFKKTYSPHESDEEHRSDNAEYEIKIAPGFGLSIAKDIASLIGGDLSTMSKDDKITHIVFTISTYPI